MKQNIEAAVKLYSGDKPIQLFVEKLPYHLEKMNEVFRDISLLFSRAGVPDFEKLPEDMAEKAKFASLYKKWNELLEAARVQGFQWSEKTYEFQEEDEQCGLSRSRSMRRFT